MAVTFAIAPPGKPDGSRPTSRALRGEGRGATSVASLPRGYVAYRASEPIAIDGKLDEKAWQAVPWTDAFVDIEGDLKPLPRFQTRGQDALGRPVPLHRRPASRSRTSGARLTKHDSVIFQDNDFEIFIDPDGDNHEYYEFEINALNTDWDLFLKKPYRDGGPAVNDWEIPGLKTAVHVDGTLNDPRDKDQFWSVEFAIPWKVLAEYAHRPAPPQDGDQWRVNFSRVEWQHDCRGRQVPQGARAPGGQLGLVAPGRRSTCTAPSPGAIVQFSTAAPGTVRTTRPRRTDPAGFAGSQEALA